MELNLTKEQSKHFESVKWLLDFTTNIESGKSHVMATAFLAIAIENPREWVNVYDHFPSSITHERLLRYIEDVLLRDDWELRAKFEFDYEANRFRVKGLL